MSAVRGRARRVGSAAALAAVCALAAGCSIAGGKVRIGEPAGPGPVLTLVSPGGERLEVDSLRIRRIYEEVRDRFEIISCARTVTVRDRPRTRTPRTADRGRPGTVAAAWNDLFGGHDSVRQRTAYCFYGAGDLLMDGYSSASPGPQDSTVHVVAASAPRGTLPWQTLAVRGDTAAVALGDGGRVPASVYAFLHLMWAQGRLEEWLPGVQAGPDADPFDAEARILEATSDAWLLMRSGYSAAPADALDELVFAREMGRLDAYVHVRRPDAFPERRAAWLAANPEAEAEYLAWYAEVFDP